MPSYNCSINEVVGVYKRNYLQVFECTPARWKHALRLLLVKSLKRSQCSHAQLHFHFGCHVFPVQFVIKHSRPTRPRFSVVSLPTNKQQRTNTHAKGMSALMIADRQCYAARWYHRYAVGRSTVCRNQTTQSAFYEFRHTNVPSRLSLSLLNARHTYILLYVAYVARDTAHLPCIHSGRSMRYNKIILNHLNL